MKTTRWWFAGFTFVAALALVGVADAVPDRKPLGPMDQGEDNFGPPPPVNKDLRINVKNIADLLKKRNINAAKNLASAAVLGLEEFYDLEQMYRLRNKGGLGWGVNPMPIATQDGIEGAPPIPARAVPPQIAVADPANEQSAWWIAAMAELTIPLAPKKDAGKKTKKLWISYADELREAAHELRAASIANNAMQLKQAAVRINNACLNCHIIFRD